MTIKNNKAGAESAKLLNFNTQDSAASVGASTDLQHAPTLNLIEATDTGNLAGGIVSETDNHVTDADAATFSYFL